MTINITSEKCNDYLLLIGKGKIESKADLDNLILDYLKIIKREKQVKVLVNEKEIIFPDDINQLVQNIEFMAEVLPVEFRKIKLAVVFNKNISDYGKCWDAYSTEFGFPWKLFFSVRDAKKWLSD